MKNKQQITPAQKDIAAIIKAIKQLDSSQKRNIIAVIKYEKSKSKH